LPSFRGTWAAVLNGADVNPPSRYLLTRTAQWLFGDGLIATRLPAIMGCWLFGICLFLFVSRRVGMIFVLVVPRRRTLAEEERVGSGKRLWQFTI
jgi:hypothetical protein